MKLARPLAVAISLLFAAASIPSSHAAPSIADLTKDRATAAEKVYRTSLALYQNGLATVDAIYTWSTRWLDAELAAAPKNTKQALADHLKRMQDLDAEAQKLFATGRARSIDTASAAYFRIEAELWSARAKR